MPMMEINVVPVGTGEVSVSRQVARALSVIKQTPGIEYQLTAMGTIITAPSTQHLLGLAQRIHEAVLAGDVQRLVTTIKIDERKDKQASIDEKVQAVKTT